MIDTQLKLLLLSNSMIEGQEYLEFALQPIRGFLGSQVSTVLFIPFAGVRVSWDDYAAKVRNRFAVIGLEVDSIHTFANPGEAVAQAQAIVVGGGNTFHLLNEMYIRDVLGAVQSRVRQGVPFIGWSAGSNLAAPTIRTTNDMPIVQPPSFGALNFVPFQINPHYLDTHPAGHKGETRAERLEEFIALNPAVTVVGLREGSWLQVENGRAVLQGPHSACIFKAGVEPLELPSGQFIRTED
ncbi:MAG: dipeptidase PepE [Blastocatellia bacterium]|nr:dipeptidase PepE [Blastocatellia bacterium]